jgi:peptidoglycan-N-acetylglucosamine deacetylase
MPRNGPIRYAVMVITIAILSSCLSHQERRDAAETKQLSSHRPDSELPEVIQQDEDKQSTGQQVETKQHAQLPTDHGDVQEPTPDQPEVEAKIEPDVGIKQEIGTDTNTSEKHEEKQQPTEHTKKPIPRTSDQPKLPKSSSRSRKPPPVKHKPVYYSAKTSRKVVALTFDDGPDDKFTPQVLDVLKKHNVKATFFLMGKRAHEHPKIVKRIQREGHVIGNHTWGHPNLNKLNESEIQQELEKTQRELQAITGIRTALFRPPYGNASNEAVDLIDALGMRTIRWSVDTRDWEGKSVAEMMGTVRKQLKPGGIILQHSAGGEGQDMTNTVELLKQLIPALRKEGYTFDTVSNLLDIPASASK